MISNLPKNERPNFPFAATRPPPNLAAVAAVPPPRPRSASATPEAMAAAQTVRAHLLGVRSGDLILPGGQRTEVTVTVGGVTEHLVVLERVAAAAGVTFYHLTNEARAVLRDGLALPWGA